MRMLRALSFLSVQVWGLVVLEELPAVPHGWTPSGSVHAETPMRLHAALKYRNLDRLEHELAAVSTPCGPRYGDYQDLSRQWSMFGPSPNSESKVKAWLEQHNAEDIRSNGQTISFTTTASKASTMMNADFRVYRRGDDARLRTTSYSVPDELAEHIDLIAPTTYFGEMSAHNVMAEQTEMEHFRHQTKRNDIQPSCLATYVSKRSGLKYEAITPECLKQLYNTGDYTPDPKSGSNIAFANFLNNTPSYSDLALFNKEFNLKGSFEILALINGGINDQNPQTEIDGEANLDVQNIVGLVDGLPVYTYITGGVAPFYPDLLLPNASADTNEPYLEYFSYLLSQPNSKIPYVLSHSYGDHENTVPDRYAARICNQIGLLGLRGRSVLFSSGDEGTGAVCRNNRPVGNLHGDPEFTVQFPTSCPYVTAVGGTQAYNPEIAWNASVGGFSRYFRTAWYQRAAVKTYLSQHLSDGTKAYYQDNNYTDFSGRAIPDISAHSLYPYYLIYVNGSRALSGGTSAAVPVVSSIIALLNDARFRAGRPAMGFLNPWLYAEASALDDVTSGSAVGCNGVNLQTGQTIPGAGIIPYASWNATAGWDPATGLGTPDFQRLKASALRACYVKPY